MSSKFTWQYTLKGFHFPAPVLRVNISNVDTGEGNSEDFLIDSGSDISFIRNEVFSKLKLIIIDEVEFEVADSDDDEDKLKKRDLTELEIEIPEIKFKGTIEVAIGKKGETNLLGRDFINSFQLLLDKGQDFTIQR